MSSAMILGGALLLDAAMGEPRWLWDRVPHPAVLMGRAIDWVDRRWNDGESRRAKGALALAGMCALALVIGDLLEELGWLIELVLAAILLAQKSLVVHLRAVADGLRLSVGDGRRAVAMIVGRDTREMGEADVARAAIESAAENLSDGVVAPAFWFVIGGLPGMLIYKLVNTADSMIGHRTPRHTEFGWAAARLDDLMNLIPARLTAVLICLRYRLLDEWPRIAADAKRHRSPNAGWPEAALARALDVALSGPRTYDGQRRDFPFVHPEGRRRIGPNEVDAACGALWQVWAVMLAMVLAVAVVLG